MGWSTTGADEDTEAFVWDEANEMRSLAQILSMRGMDLTGWTLHEATGIAAAESDSGEWVIVGTGTNPMGHEVTWRAVVPEPGSSLLGTAAIALLALLRHRRQSTT